MDRAEAWRVQGNPMLSLNNVNDHIYICRKMTSLEALAREKCQFSDVLYVMVDQVSHQQKRGKGWNVA